MKYQKAVFMLVMMGSLVWVGCEQPQQPVEPTVDTSQVNRKVVDTYSDLAIQNAIIAQHTLYPYHFVSNGVQLNGLGHRDLSVLISHFQDNPGTINVPQGDSNSELYQGRIQTVYEQLMQGGVPEEKIQIASGMPGGDGMPSNAMIEILETAKTSEASQGYEMDVDF